MLCIFHRCTRKHPHQCFFLLFALVTDLPNEEVSEDSFLTGFLTRLCHQCSQIDYAELLWVDRLGMYVRVEAADHLDGLVVSAQPNILFEIMACAVGGPAGHVCACGSSRPP